jgi:hypothetical protein
MTDRTKNVLSLILVVASVVLLGSAYLYYRRPVEPPPPLGAAAEDPVTVEEILSPFAFTFELGVPAADGADVLALFLLKSTVCPPCLNEVQDYVELIDRLNRQGADVLPVALVFEPDPERAARFLRAAALPIPAGYGDPPELAARLGRREGATVPVLQQLVLVDTDREVVFHRIALLNTVTPVEMKVELLDRAFESRPPEWSLAGSAPTPSTPTQGGTP